MNEDFNISASFIIEILGKPIDHVKETMERFVKEIGEEKGVFINEQIIHEPREFDQGEGKEKVFTTFAEIDADFEKVEALVNLVFKYTPSHIEITRPEKLVFKNDYFGEFLTGVILRLHKYDEIAKKLVMDNTILQNKLKELKKD
jgi:hypothetical protein